MNQINQVLIKGNKLYNKLLQEWLENNDIVMCSTHNKVKLVTAETFIKTLKDKFYKEKRQLMIVNLIFLI